MSYALCPCLCVSLYLCLCVSVYPCLCPCVPGSDLGDFPDQQSRLCPAHGHEDNVDGDDDNDEQVDDSRTVFVDNSMIRCFHFMMRQLS